MQMKTQHDLANMAQDKVGPYVDDDATGWLLKHFNDEEASISSLWREQSDQFQYVDGNFEGLTGFGNYEAPMHGLRRALHWLLMAPFRRMGEKFRSFRRIHKIARDIASRQNRNYNLDILRQTITVSFLLEHVRAELENDDGFILTIGDGFGTFSALILSVFPNARVIMVNLTKVLLADIVYLRKGVTGVSVALANDDLSLAKAVADRSIRAVAIRSDDAGLLKNVRISLATNIVSMQEMNPSVIAEYFDVMRHALGAKPVFYCCNRENKTLTDGTVVVFNEYPWRDDDEILVDELCPWNEYRYATRPPFYRPYDGPIRHRLARLAKD